MSLLLLPIFEHVVVILFGAVLGSFATAVTYRELNNTSWTFKKKHDNDVSPHRSRCPHCKTILGIPDLIPIISWLFLKGQCRHCGNKIALTYPAMEFLSVSACLGIYWSYGFTLQAAVIASSVPFLLSLAVIDLKKMILPNNLMLILAILGGGHVALKAIEGGEQIIFDHSAAAMLYGLIAFIVAFLAHKILKKPGLGMGDIKLFAVAGLWLGIIPMAEFYMLSGFFGVIMALIWRAATKSKVFPFGPAMLFSLYSLLLAKTSFLFSFIIQ